MNELPQEFKKDHYDKVMFLVGLIEQLNTMVHVLYLEKQKIEKQKEEAESKTVTKSEGLSLFMSIPIINTTHETALKASIIFFQFSVIEAIVNMLCDLTIQINNGVYFEPKTKLKQSEIDFLAEKTSFFDPKKNEVAFKSSFKRLEDKICTVPFLFAKSMGRNYKLDRGNNYWESFKKNKLKRDSLTHPKVKRTYVTDEEIFNGSGIIYWLSENYFFLIRDSIYPEENLLYKHIENSTSRLMKLTYFSTLEQFSLKPFIKKQNDFKNNK